MWKTEKNYNTNHPAFPKNIRLRNSQYKQKKISP